MCNQVHEQNLNNEYNDEADVDEDEQDPEQHAGCEDTEDLQDQSQTNDKEDVMSCVGDIAVTELVHLQEHQYGDAVHEGRVKLEVLRGGADVIAATEDSLQGQGSPHGVEYSVALGYSNIQWVSVSQIPF